MTLARLPQWLIGVGFGVWLVAVAWSALAGRRALYSEADSKAYEDAQLRLRQLVNQQAAGEDQPGLSSDEAGSPAIEQAQAELARAAAKRDRAHLLGGTLPRIARWLGVLVALAGLVVYFVRKDG